MLPSFFCGFAKKNMTYFSFRFIFGNRLAFLEIGPGESGKVEIPKCLMLQDGPPTWMSQEVVNG